MISAHLSAPVASLDRRFYAFALDRLIAWSLVGAADAWRMDADLLTISGVRSSCDSLDSRASVLYPLLN